MRADQSNIHVDLERRGTLFFFLRKKWIDSLIVFVEHLSKSLMRSLWRVRKDPKHSVMKLSQISYAMREIIFRFEMNL
jgi:hypothetical protein